MISNYELRIFLAFIAFSCTNVKTDETPEEPVVVEPELLPDTTFSSVEVLDYEIEIVDSRVSGDLKFTHSEYTDTLSALTFRGNPFRDADFHATVKGRPTKIVKDWEFETGMGKPSAFGGS